MTGWQQKARISAVNPLWIAGISFALIHLCDPAQAQIGVGPDGSFIAAAQSGSRAWIWEISIGAFVIVAFLAAIILWVMTALRKARHTNVRNSAFVSSALNNVSQGIAMLNARKQLVFCNDRYLEIYGLTRSDVWPYMTRGELVDLRVRRGTLKISAEEYHDKVDSPEDFICETSGGKSILVRHRKLPNGGIVSTHDDCTKEHALSKELATTKSFLESVIDNIPVCVGVRAMEDGRYILVNRAFERFVGKSREEIVGGTVRDIFAPDAEAILAADRAVLASPEGRTFDEYTLSMGGETRYMATNRVVARNEKNEPEFLIVLFEDVTDRRSMSDELQSAKKFLELVVDNIPVALVVKRLSDNQYVLANHSAEAILTRRREDVIGLTVNDVYNERDAKFIGKRDDDAVRKKGVVTEEHPIQTENGLRLFLTRRVTVLNDAGEPEYLINTNEDITDRRETESRMAHMAYHDSLTKLPNRAAFLQALTQMIDACEGTDEEFAVLSLDLDRLKEVNDVFGHEVGDRILIEVSRRIQESARGGVVARLSGDEFGLIIDGPQPDAAAALAASVSEALRREFAIEDRSIRIGVTTGISIFPRNGATAETLLANADAALFRAKATSRSSIKFFEAEMDQKIRDRRALHQDLSHAIRNGELSLHYQPQFRLRRDEETLAVAGFEALARWVHPARGNISPADFIPLAEESGLIVEMGEWILREACREAASWPTPRQVAVNLSPAQFMQGDVVALVHSVLLETGLQPARLELEITEGVLIEDMERGLSLLRRLKSLGVNIAMDDFGSGYSSLTYLQAFPFDKIKIDRVFVMNLGRNRQSAAIIRAVVGLGEGLSIPIVAEGVETQAQLDFLREVGCHQVQGYFSGKPAPISNYAGHVGRSVAEAETARLTG